MARFVTLYRIDEWVGFEEDAIFAIGGWQRTPASFTNAQHRKQVQACRVDPLYLKDETSLFSSRSSALRAWRNRLARTVTSQELSLERARAQLAAFDASGLMEGAGEAMESDQ